MLWCKMYTQEDINKWCDQGKMILCFDLDGTLCEFGFKNGLHDCKPKQGVISRVRRLSLKYTVLKTGFDIDKYSDLWLLKKRLKKN